MCSCRPHRAGMSFCRVMVRVGVRYHGKLSRWHCKNHDSTSAWRQAYRCWV